jgi:hypothetical protein
MPEPQQQLATQQPKKKVQYVENTVFLVPDLDFDQKVIGVYLRNKYEGIPRDMIAHQFVNSIVMYPGVRIVVCVRRPREYESLGPNFVMEYDAIQGCKVERKIPPEAYAEAWPKGEVYESEPIVVSQYVKAERAHMFRPVKPDPNKLINKLCEEAWPCRVTPQNEPDFMIRCEYAGS